MDENGIDSFEVDAGTFTLVDHRKVAMDFDDDRQLSADLEKVKLQNAEDDVVTTGFAGQGMFSQEDVKKEFREPCMYVNSGRMAQGDGAFSGRLPGFDTFTQASGSSHTSSPWLRPESQNATWNHWDNDASLSSTDLSMDRAPSIPFSQVASPHISQVKPTSLASPYDQSCFEGFSQGQGHLTGLGVPTRYPHEDKLRRYSGQETVNETNDDHQQWRNVVQSQQQYMKSPVQATDDDMAVDHEDEVYTYEADEFGDGPLHILTCVNDRKVLAQSLDMLLKCGVVQQCINLQNKLKQTPLFLAVFQNNIGFVQWLLENGADPNIQGTLYTNRDEYIWRAPLHLAAMKGDQGEATLRILLTKSKHTDINLFSYGDKLTALHMALKDHKPSYSCRKIIMELISRHADITLRDQSSSKTPFMLALETRDLNLIQDFLNKFNAEGKRTILQEQTRSGDTCLHIAAGLSRMESADKERLLRYLVINGANGNVMNNVKELPKDFARKEWESIRKT